MRKLRNILITILVILLSGFIVAISGYFYLSKELPNTKQLEDVKLQYPMQIFTIDGKLIAEIGEQHRTPVSLNEIPQSLIDAFIVTEDARFYEHNGFDIIGIIRAAWASFNGKIQGASTITQQLARNFFLTRDRTIKRKIKEIILAINIEHHFNKNKILELYLNKIYFGYRAYGIVAAARTYFGKDLKDLTLGEIAILAGLPKAPSVLNPIYSVTNATNRRNVVLKRMLETGKITEQQYENAKNEVVYSKFHGTKVDLQADYATEMIRQEMIRRFGQNIAYNSGLKVYATISSTAQAEAQKALRMNLINYDARGKWRGAEQLWQEDEQPWSAEKIKSFLKKLPEASPLIPMVVTQTDNDNYYLVDPDLNNIAIDRTQIVFNKSNIALQVGEQIWMYLKDKKYTLAQIPQANSALVSLNSDNGSILSVVGGFSFEISKFNRATQSLVQVGSSIKPFIYAAALNKGLTLSTVISDDPVVILKPNQEPWKPKNYNDVYEQPLRARVGLGKSKNMIAIRVMQIAGVKYVANYLQRFGFLPNEYVATEALALGAASFTPLEMARGFAVFNNGGFLIEPYIIDHITDVNGRTVYSANPAIACDTCDIPVSFEDPKQFDLFSIDLNQQENNKQFLNQDNALLNQDNDEIENEETEFDLNKLTEGGLEENIEHNAHYAQRVISSDISFLMRSALHTAIVGEPQNNWRGSGIRIARTIKREDIGGKTGTTNNSKTAWFNGFASNIVTSVYVGFDDNKLELGQGESGSRTAIPAWQEYMQQVLKDRPERDQTPPNDIVTVEIDPKTGLLGKGQKEYFIKGTEPTKGFIYEKGLNAPKDNNVSPFDVLDNQPQEKGSELF